MTRARATTTDGRHKVSEATRAKLSAASKAAYDRMTPEQQAAQKSRLVRPPKRAGSNDTGKPPATSDPPDPGRRNPLAMTPLELFRAVRGGPKPE